MKEGRRKEGKKEKKEENHKGMDGMWMGMGWG
jgi:hypothetical protein